MVTVVTREENGIPLTHDQVDNNFTDLANAVNSIGADVIAEAVDAKNEAVSAANAASTSASNASNSADAASISSGNAATSAEQAASAAATAVGIFRDDLAAPDGTDNVGFGDLNLTQYLDRGNSNFGRWSASDLGNFFEAVRGYRYDLRPELPILGLGSSVGLAEYLGDPSQAPVNWFVSQLKQKFDPADQYNIKVYNRSVNGSTLSEFKAVYLAFLAEMAAAGKRAPVIVHLVPGMNDGSPAIFNSGQTYNGFVDAGIELNNLINKNGASCIWNTTPHPATVLHPDALLAMPSGVDQIYPVFKAKPVLPEQMTPPRSASLITADFVGNGVNISMSFRYLLINQAMRDICQSKGATLIDVEWYWKQAYQKYTVATGSTAGAELALYGPVETVHPNLLAHQLTYQAGANDFTDAIFRQKGQRGGPVKLSGYYDLNRREPGVPDVVWGVCAPYPDKDTVPTKVSAYIGALDPNNIPARMVVLEVDPTTGDLVQGGGAWRLRTVRTPDAALVVSADLLYSAYGINGKSSVLGKINISSAWILDDMPDASAGELFVRGQQGSSTVQIRKYTWWRQAGVMNIQEQVLGSPIGTNVFTVAVASNKVNITPVNANTNIQIKWDSLGF